jgi:EAL domain-containing protein (putative c-di-GMP-specific phosphodiesterase class I)
MGSPAATSVCAEGIETEAEVGTGRDLGYELAQGYLLAKPMPIDALTAQVRAEVRVRPTTAD